MEEKNKPYVEFARAKGFSNKYILYVHLLRNIMYHLLNHLQYAVLVHDFKPLNGRRCL